MSQKHRVIQWNGWMAAVLLAVPAWGEDIPVRADSPGKGLLSMGVYDASDTLVRSLTYAKPVDPGQVALSWDATNDLGLPVAPGEYQVRGAWFPDGPKITMKMKVGVSGAPPYVLANGLGGWGGNLGAPRTVCTNGKQMVAVFGCVEDNLNTGIQLMDADGKILRRYHSFFPWDVRLSGAMDAQNLYLAVADFGAKKLVIGKYKLEEPRGKVLVQLPCAGKPCPSGLWKDRWEAQMFGLALNAGRLYAPVVTDNKLFVVDAESGKILQAVDVPSPRGVAAAHGTVYVLSGTKLLKLDSDGKTTGTILDAGLDDPAGLAIDGQGNFLIADRGVSQQVKVFSPDGRLLRAIGEQGGRPVSGRFNPKGMLDPAGLCAGPDGAIWVAEDHEVFQRVSVWDPGTGALRKDYFNTRISSGLGQLSPDRTEMHFTYGCFGDVCGVMSYRIDLEKGTWYPSWSAMMNVPNDLYQNDVFRGHGHVHGQNAIAFNKINPYLDFTGGQIKADSGKTYAFGGEFSLYLVDPTTQRMKLAALVYTHRVDKNEKGELIGNYDQGPNRWLAWSDLNGDGKMVRDEIKLAENPPLLEQTSRLFGLELQKDLSLLMLAPTNCNKRRQAELEMQKKKQSSRVLPPFEWTVFRLTPKEILPSGAPVYDWAALQKVCDLKVPSFEGGDGWKGGRAAFAFNPLFRNGSIYATAEAIPDAKLRLQGIDGDGWWASRNWRKSTLRFDPQTGQASWLKLGRRAPGLAQPGEMYYPTQTLAGGDGVVDGFMFIPDTMGQVWCWTDTGLYVGPLYHEPRQGIHDGNGLFVELTGSWIYKIGGKVYSCAGDHGVNVHEVELPKLTPIRAGKVTVTDALAKAAKPWDPDGPSPGKRPVYAARSFYNHADQKQVRTITVDGKLDPAEWDGLKPMTMTAEGGRSGEVFAAWDRKDFYLAYRVKDASGLKNAGTELPACPFVSGAYVDFCLGTDWTTPQRDGNLAGDVRVILARITGPQSADFQTGFWPVKKGGRNPRTITSPAAQRTFDDIAPIAGLTFASQATPDGYTVEVSAPLKALGLDEFGKFTSIGFDCSFAFANPEGTVRQGAAHWAGESEATVVDRPGSAALKPFTWGTLILDRSPVDK